MELKVYRSDSATAALVVGHGAGAGQNSPFMVRTAEGLAARGIAAATFDFPYMTARRSVPDRPPVLEQAWRDAIAQARTELGGLPLFIGGKSMGGRIASQVASQGVEGVSGLVFLGYPLHPPGKPEQRRDAHLPGDRAADAVRPGHAATPSARPTRFVQLLPDLQHATLHEVPGGDHSFKVSGRGAPKPDAVLNGILDVVPNGSCSASAA